MPTYADVMFEEGFDSPFSQFNLEGNAFVSNGQLRLRGDSNNSPGNGWARSQRIDLSGFNKLTLSYDRTTQGLDAGESGEAFIHIDGGGAEIINTEQNGSGRFASVFRVRENKTDIMIAFRVQANSFFESYTIDNVVLEGEVDEPTPDGCG